MAALRTSVFRMAPLYRTPRDISSNAGQKAMPERQLPKDALPELNDPNGTRTRVTAVKGRCPRPLDDGAPRFEYKPGKDV